MARLTETSYAVLALLARRPYSAYELTGEIRSSLAQCMPRSATLLYREPKNLVAHGLVTAEAQLRGRQKRVIYSITADGRRALRDWFSQPPAAPVFESETVLRLIFGHLGNRDQLLRALAELETRVCETSERGFAGFPGWFERFPPPTEHLHDQALVAELYVDLYRLLISWSRRARRAVEARPRTWPRGSEEVAMRQLEKVLARAPRAVDPTQTS